jgi:hypothetical protein
MMYRRSYGLETIHEMSIEFAGLETLSSAFEQPLEIPSSLKTGWIRELLANFQRTPQD